MKCRMLHISHRQRASVLPLLILNLTLHPIQNARDVAMHQSTIHLRPNPTVSIRVTDILTL